MSKKRGGRINRNLKPYFFLFHLKIYKYSKHPNATNKYICLYLPLINNNKTKVE